MKKNEPVKIFIVTVLAAVFIGLLANVLHAQDTTNVSLPFKARAPYQGTVQCIGETSKGEQCKRRMPTPEFTDEHELKCWQHTEKANRCGAKTKKGKACRRITKVGQKCYNHKN